MISHQECNRIASAARAGGAHEIADRKDAVGKLFIREMLDTAWTKGSGTVEYHWLDPTSNKTERKIAYFKRAGIGLSRSAITRGTTDAAPWRRVLAPSETVRPVHHRTVGADMLFQRSRLVFLSVVEANGCIWPVTDRSSGVASRPILLKKSLFILNFKPAQPSGGDCRVIFGQVYSRRAELTAVRQVSEPISVQLGPAISPFVVGFVQSPPIETHLWHR